MVLIKLRWNDIDYGLKLTMSKLIKSWKQNPALILLWEASKIPDIGVGIPVPASYTVIPWSKSVTLLVCGRVQSRTQVGLTPKIFLFCLFFFFSNRTFDQFLLGNTDVQGWKELHCYLLCHWWAIWIPFTTYLNKSPAKISLCSSWTPQFIYNWPNLYWDCTPRWNNTAVILKCLTCLGYAEDDTSGRDYQIC